MGGLTDLPEAGERTSRELSEIGALSLARRLANVAPANGAGTSFAAPPRRGSGCLPLVGCYRRPPAPSQSEGPAASKECGGEGEKQRSSAPMVDDISGTRMLLG